MPETEPNDQSEKVYQIHQSHRTWRYLIVTGGIVGSIWIIADAYVKVATAPQLAWVTLIAVIVSVIAVFYVPSTYWVGKIKAYMSHDHQRTIELEASVDSKRTSSGLKPTGDPEDENV